MKSSSVCLVTSTVLAYLICSVLGTDADAEKETATATSAIDGGIKYLTAADDVPTCKLSDANANECVRKLFDIMVPRLKNGDPEVGIPPYDPFILNRTSFQYNNGPITSRITMRNAKVYGFPDMQNAELNFTFNGNEGKMHHVVFLPEMNISGEYKADVAYNNVRLRPRGSFNVTLVGVNITVDSDGIIYEKDNHRFVRLKKMEVVPTITDLKINANGIFPDPTLNELVLNIAHEYWKQIYAILLPETRRFWGPMVLNLLNEIFSKVPFDNFLSE